MAFERLLRAVLDRGETVGVVDRASAAAIQRGLLDRMASIGVLEGSEEGGVDEIPDPDVMVESVHRVRGGALFALAFAGPDVLEDGEVWDRMLAAERAVAQLGTAFQIVDDLTDFEFDISRRSHNLLVAQIHHHGTPEERSRLDALLAGAAPEPEEVEGPFRASARAVLERAYEESRHAFRDMAALGFWFPERLADEVVHAIVGLEGIRRMGAIAAVPTTGD